MPQIDRHRTRTVQIEFEAHEDFSGIPSTDRVSIVFITNGKLDLFLNKKAGKKRPH